MHHQLVEGDDPSPQLSSAETSGEFCPVPTPQHERHGHIGMNPERAVDTIQRESLVDGEAGRTQIV